MKKLLFIAALFIANISFAQWNGGTGTGQDINRTGRVSIGTGLSYGILTLETATNRRLWFNANGMSTEFGDNLFFSFTNAHYRGGFKWRTSSSSGAKDMMILYDNGGNVRLELLTNRLANNEKKLWFNNEGMTTAYRDNQYFNFTNAHWTGGFRWRTSTANGTRNMMSLNDNGTDVTLTVGGLIHAQEIQVSTNAWPDFVFAKDYELMSLTETAKFIEKNHHLPGIPKAEILDTAGVNLGEMQRLQMMKIEEITLHLITVANEKDQLAEENKALKARLEELAIKQEVLFQELKKINTSQY